MNNNNTPAYIARQTLIKLANTSLPPTPENYAAAYNQIAGHKDTETPSIIKSLQKVLAIASKNNPKLIPREKAINLAVRTQNLLVL